MITIKFFIIIVTLLLIFTLYILLGINDFQLQKKQLFALIPLLLLLLTLYRMDNIPTIYDSVKNENNIHETPIQQEEVVKVEVPVMVTHSKSIEVAERQLQDNSQNFIVNIIPIVKNENKKEIKINDLSHINQASKSLPFVAITSLILSNLNPQTILQNGL